MNLDIGVARIVAEGGLAGFMLGGGVGIYGREWGAAPPPLLATLMFIRRVPLPEMIKHWMLAC